MHETIRVLIHTAAGAFDLKGPVYEFGYSPTGNPSDAVALRDCFPHSGYLGCEVSPPAEIDRLADLSRLPFPDGAARTVVCVDTLEHVYEPPRAVEEMARILMPGGVLVLSASVEPEGPISLDNYWRLTPQVVERLMSPFEATLVAWQGNEESPHTVYGVGCKAPIGDAFVRGLNRFMVELPDRIRQSGGRRGWLTRVLGAVLGRPGSAGARHTAEDRRLQFAVHLPLSSQVSSEFLLGTAPQERTGTRLDLSQ